MEISPKARQILAILQRASGPVRFSEISRQVSFSKSTTSKYLKDLIEKEIIRKVRDKGGKRFRYSLSDPIQVNSLSDFHENLDQMVGFLHSINVPETQLWQITSLVSTRPEAFVKLPQTPELYLSLFYIYYNLTSTPLFIRRREYCEFCRIKEVALDYYLDKILSVPLGFHHIEHLGGDYFFHDIDELGRALAGEVEQFVRQFVLQVQYRKRHRSEMESDEDGQSVLPIEDFLARLVPEFLRRGLIDHRIKEAFLKFGWRYVVQMAIEMKLPTTMLPEIPSPGPIFTPSRMEDIRGYCPRCGNWILQRTVECTRCGELVVEDRTLLYDFVRAQELARKFKDAGTR